jgi:predicted methyltransferase
MLPLLTLKTFEQLERARKAGALTLECSLDLDRSATTVTVTSDAWSWLGQSYPYPDRCKERTIYRWSGVAFEPVARFSTGLYKLVPTEWGPPTFEIDGIKMLPSATVSPLADAAHKVGRVAPRGKRILDTCGGLGYFAACCLEAGAAGIRSFEKSADVLWLREQNPWSPVPDSRIVLTHGDITEQIGALGAGSFDAILHDPPRFGIAGELYSQDFYHALARVLAKRGRLFHYTGSPNRVSRGRDLPGEVIARLKLAGFTAEPSGDGVIAAKR